MIVVAVAAAAAAEADNDDNEEGEDNKIIIHVLIFVSVTKCLIYETKFVNIIERKNFHLYFNKSNLRPIS